MKYTKLNRKWIKEFFTPDFDRGLLIHRQGRFAGRPAGCENDGGYIVIKHKGRAYYAHRMIAQLKTYSDISRYHVHHLNHDKGDNRPENLLLISQDLHNGIRRSSGRQTLKFRGIVKRAYSFGTRYHAKLTVLGQIYHGPKRTTQMAAWEDYCRLYAKHRGLLHAPDDVLRTYISS